MSHCNFKRVCVFVTKNAARSNCNCDSINFSMGLSYKVILSILGEDSYHVECLSGLYFCRLRVYKEGLIDPTSRDARFRCQLDSNLPSQVPKHPFNLPGRFCFWTEYINHVVNNKGWSRRINSKEKPYIIMYFVMG